MIALRKVSKSFGGKRILRDIDLQIMPDEITFIVGTSGSGKTTLLNIMGGLDVPSSGEVVLDGKSISDDLSEFRRTKVGFVFQDYNLIPGLSVRDNIELALLFAGRKGAVPEQEIKEQTERLGIKDIGQPAETLSGGEKQRTAIVRSICKRSDLILADEPTGNLDSTNAQIVMNELVSLKKGRHVVIVSHDLVAAKALADRIITISDGRITEDIRNDA
ncbi:ABC transporter ATP-binding protein [Candidatus Nomurabacteria bacterium]|nr:ABC transporter ATP-binding protein [Candidatus Nomurabacteria bacterium]